MRVSLPGVRFSALSLALAALCAAPLPAQQMGLDVSQTLFEVMLAINAAGYDADVDSASNHPLRVEIRKAASGVNLSTIEELKKFFAKHRKKDWGAELGQYVSFALCVKGPPDFEYRLKAHELPPDVVPLEGFGALMTRLHKEADLEMVWKKVQPVYEKALEQYQAPITQALLEVNGYLRVPSLGAMGRSFKVIVELLAAPNQVQTRSYGDDYFVVLTPAQEPLVNDVRHSFLHFHLDQLAVKHFEPLEKKRGLIDYAQAAPRCPPTSRTIFSASQPNASSRPSKRGWPPAARRGNWRWWMPRLRKATWSHRRSMTCWRSTKSRSSR